MFSFFMPHGQEEVDAEHLNRPRLLGSRTPPLYDRYFPQVLYFSSFFSFPTFPES